MSSPFFFFYQQQGKESKWQLDSADNRASVIATHRPAFSTILDLTTIPEGNDWGKVRYQGPFYADFDAEGDLDLVCSQFETFLLKLSNNLDFDLTQAKLYATGSKGFHVEIPQACFMPKVPPTGTAWLAYVYRAMAESLMVDTLDLNVYTGKKGRQWRTPNVQRENGCYKVALTLEEALGMTPDLYLELIKEPREEPVRTPPFCNSKFAILFSNSKDKVVTQMRGKAKRQKAAGVILDPWKKAKQTPPTIEGLMDGSLVAQGAGFQDLAMQLSIYATSVEMPLAEFLERCTGLCNNHVSDSKRYGSFEKRQAELSRMWNYMNESSLYDFEVGPLRKLVKSTSSMADLGIMETEDKGDKPASATDEATPEAPDADMHKGIRKGFFMNADGMWKRNGDVTESICRATFRNVESFYDAQHPEKFMGYEFDLVQKGAKTFRTMLGADSFTSASMMKKFMVNNQIGFQGGDFEVMSLVDVMSEKAKRGGKVYTYPREGFMLINNPHVDQPEPVKVYLTQTTFVSSLAEDDPAYFRLRYRPEAALSSYNIDIDKAPDLDDSLKGAIHDLFSFTRESEAADLIGWFVACHYRSVYLKLFKEFPMLQVWGEAGAGKTQTIQLLARLHWYANEVPVKSSASCTPYVLDCHASSSTSAPLILDEFKPRELIKQGKGKYEKLKDMFRMSYNGNEIGERGTVNKGAENSMGIIRNRATAPVVFMGEAIEMETAIIERSVTVNLTKAYQTKQRARAFERLRADPTALSAIGCALLQAGFALNIEGMRTEVNAIQDEITKGMPEIDDEYMKAAAPRMIRNRAIVIHGLRILKYVLHEAYGSEFDAPVDALLASKMNMTLATADSGIVAIASMSEISKVVSRIALLSRDRGTHHEMIPNKDYAVGPGWVEIRVERSYDQYRRYCASISDTPLFDSVESFTYALNAYSPCIDKQCATSDLRDDGSSERIVRLSIKALAKEGVQSFRT